VLPEAGDVRLQQVLHKVRLLALRRLLTLEAPGTLRAPFGRLQHALTQALASEARVVLTAVGSCDVLCPLLALQGRSVTAEAALSAAIPALLCTLSALGFRPAAAILWDVPITRMADATRGQVTTFEPPAQGLSFNAQGIELRLADGSYFAYGAAPRPGVRIERPFHRLHAELPAAFALFDSNPLSLLEAHPNKQGNAIDLGERSIEAWCGALSEALDLVKVALPALAAELRASLLRVVPVGFHAEQHLSASYREAPGLIYLTLHPSPLTLAEAIIHETQHGKLNALSWLDPVMHNGHSEWTRSPVRPDMRPLMGVLLALHAFVPVSELHRSLAEQGHPIASTPEFRSRRAEVLEQNSRAIEALRPLASFSELGARVFAGLEALHAAARKNADH
jgi:HEXXH motif-containing protein